MKNLPKYLLFVVLLGHIGPLLGGLGPFMSIFNTKWEGKTFVQLVENDIEELKKRQEAAEKAHADYKSLLETTQKNVATLKETMSRVRGTELEYTSQYMVVVNKTALVLSDLVQVYHDIQVLLQEHMKALEEYKEDPEFSKKGLPLEQKSIYSIEDFQRIMSIVLRYDSELNNLTERREKISADILALKKNLELSKQSLAEKKQEQKELKEQKPEPLPGRQKFTLKQQGAILDAEDRLLTYTRDLTEARLKEADIRLQVVEFQIKTTKLQLDTLLRQEDHVRQELRIDRKDIELAQRKLRQQIQESSRLQEDYNRRIEGLNLLRQSELDQIALVKQRASLNDETLDKIYDWSFRPVSVLEWRALLEIGRLHDHIAFETDVLKEIFQARVEQEKVNVTAQEVASSIIQTWEAVTNGTFDGSSDSLNKEIKKYEKLLADLESSLSSLEDKHTAASRLLAQNSAVAEAIQARLKEFISQRETIFKADPAIYSRLGEVLKNEGQIEAQKRSELITQLIELYTSLAQQRTLITKKIDMMIRVLRSKVQDKLVPPLWNGVKRFVPDLGRFVTYLATPGRLHTSIEDARNSLTSWSIGLLTHPLSLLVVVMYLLAVIALYTLLRMYLRESGILITHFMKPEYGFISVIAGLLGLLVQFIADHLEGIFVWSMLLLLVKYAATTYLATLFYLLSIPFWLYYVHRFIRYAKSVNTSREYPLASKKYHERFFWILAVFLSATVILVFFREAMARVLPQSDAPRILLAINFIVFQVSLIFMISREQILLLIPRHTSLGKWIQELVDDYYYLFLIGIIFIIVMSNPYIGFGTSFLYLIGRILLIVVLIPLVIMLDNALKSFLSSFFFYSDEEGRLNDRFPYARTSYGLFIIGSFLFLSIAALIMAANVWGLKIGYQEIISWLRKEWYSYQSAETGVKVAVNFIHFIRVFFYVFIGVLIAFLINKFVLRRMFDLLMVNAGIQSIFLSLIRYVIVFVAILIGLQSIGLGSNSLFIFLGTLAGLGVAGKEVIADFIGYFLILMQRPLKIGDFVRIGGTDEKGDLEGIVRHLNLRSVILRRKNSVTVIVPNSYVLSRPLANWNYYRMYFAFDDILITVPYSADPDKVREIFLKVLDDNYEVLRNPAPVVRLQAFAENGFEFMVRGYLSHDKVYEQHDIASNIRLELVRILRKHGYKVAVPSRILKLVKEGKEEFVEAVLDQKNDE